MVDCKGQIPCSIYLNAAKAEKLMLEYAEKEGTLDTDIQNYGIYNRNVGWRG